MVDLSRDWGSPVWEEAQGEWGSIGWRRGEEREDCVNGKAQNWNS